MRAREIRSTLLLILAALVWGVAFVAQSVGADYVGAFTFLSLRTYLGVAVLVPVAVFMRRKGSDAAAAGAEDGRYAHPLLCGGLVCGFFLFAASAAQQIGIAYTTAAKSGFVTAMYVILVPIISIFIGRRPPAKLWISVALTVAGLYLLCMRGSFRLGYGDLLTLLAALLFAFQILALGHFVRYVDGVRLTLAQFAFEAVFATACMLLWERGTAWEQISAALPAIIYAGVMSGGVGYTLQAVGERDVSPAIASLAMCMESVFSAVFGWIILGETLSARELSGCALMTLSVVFAELPVEQFVPGRHQGVRG